MSRFYRLMLDDYSAVSFTSFDKNYYGTLDQINKFFECMKADTEVALRQKYILSVYEQFLAGHKTISHVVAYHEVPFLIPAKVLGLERLLLTDCTWEHLNTWKWTYMIKCDHVESSHIWLSCYGRYCRCILARFTNLRYGTEDELYMPLTATWGYPGIIVGKMGNLFSTLYIEEKVFKNKAEALKDRCEFIHKPDPMFKNVFDEIFGDG